MDEEKQQIRTRDGPGRYKKKIEEELMKARLTEMRSHGTWTRETTTERMIKLRDQADVTIPYEL